MSALSETHRRLHRRQRGHDETPLGSLAHEPAARAWRESVARPSERTTQVLAAELLSEASDPDLFTWHSNRDAHQDLVYLEALGHQTPDAAHQGVTMAIGYVVQPEAEIARCIGPLRLITRIGTVPTMYPVDVITGWVNVPSQYPALAFNVELAGAAPEASLIASIPHTDAPPRESVSTDAAAEYASEAFAAFKDLGRWLTLDDEHVASIVRIGRTTAYAWERDGRSPRTATERWLYQIHATVAALIQRLGEDAATSFVSSGDRSPVSLLLAGDHELALRVMEAAVFDAPRRPNITAWTPDPDDDPIERSTGAAPRPRRRRRSRARASD